MVCCTCGLLVYGVLLLIGFRFIAVFSYLICFIFLPYFGLMTIFYSFLDYSLVLYSFSYYPAFRHQYYDLCSPALSVLLLLLTTLLYLFHIISVRYPFYKTNFICTFLNVLVLFVIFYHIS